MEGTLNNEQELDVARGHGILCAPKAILTLGFYLIWSTLAGISSVISLWTRSVSVHEMLPN